MIEFKCPNCSAVLKAPSEYAGKNAKCKKCASTLKVPVAAKYEEIQVELPELDPSPVSKRDNQRTRSLADLMLPEDAQMLGVDKLPPHLAKAWLDWGMRMYALGQHHIGDIQEIKYDGHLVILDDGSRWEVDESDTATSDSWLEGERVVVVDNEMYKLDEFEKVAVEED